VASPSSYFLCGTPRTGSTLLCSLLSSTGVLGRPESYFREPDEAEWAQRLGLATDGARVRDYRNFVQAVRATGTTDNGVFAARVMWGSLGRIVTGLGEPHGRSELATLEQAFGPLTFVHLQREDAVAQAVSWSRAEQTEFWQHGDIAGRAPEQDLDQMKDLVRTISEHNAAWRAWFADNGVQPHEVTYEQLTRDRRATIEGIADRLQVRVPATWPAISPHQKQADEVNENWSAMLRAALDS